MFTVMADSKGCLLRQLPFNITLFVLPAPPSRCCPNFLPFHYSEQEQFRLYFPLSAWPSSHMPRSKLPFRIRNLRKVKRNDNTSTWEEDAFYRSTLFTVLAWAYKTRQCYRMGLLQLSTRHSDRSHTHTHTHSYCTFEFIPHCL